MCGIFGVYSFNQKPLTIEKGIFLELAKANYPRGPRGFGSLALSTTQGTQPYYCSTMNTYPFSKWIDSLGEYIDKYKAYAYLGHCRAPTGGTHEFLHPHVLPDTGGANWSGRYSFFAHNGLMLDFQALSKLSGLMVNDIDTVHIHQYLLHGIHPISIEDKLSYLAKIPGSFSFWWFTTINYKLRIGRCQGTVYYNISDYFVFSSVKTDLTPHLMNDGDLYTIGIDGALEVTHFEAYNPLL